MIGVTVFYILGIHSLVSGLGDVGSLGGLGGLTNKLGVNDLIDTKRITNVAGPLLDKVGINLLSQPKSKAEPLKSSDDAKSDNRDNPASRAESGSGSSGSNSEPSFSQMGFPGLGPVSLNAGSEGAASQSSNANGIDYRSGPPYGYAPYQPVYQGNYNEIPRYTPPSYNYDSSPYYDNYNSSPNYDSYNSNPYYDSSYSNPYSDYSFNNPYYQNQYSNNSPYYEGPEQIDSYYPYFGSSSGYY